VGPLQEGGGREGEEGGAAVVVRHTREAADSEEDIGKKIPNFAEIRIETLKATKAPDKEQGRILEPLSRKQLLRLIGNVKR
jgi:hypothetical protein